MSMSFDSTRDQLYTALTYQIIYVRELEFQALVFGEQCPPTVRCEIAQLHEAICAVARRLVEPLVEPFEDEPLLDRAVGAAFAIPQPLVKRAASAK